MWKGLSIVAVIAGALLVLLAAVRTDGDAGVLFRILWTGMAVAAIGGAGLYAEKKAGDEE